jgi:hypothetical protein
MKVFDEEVDFCKEDKEILAAKFSQMISFIIQHAESRARNDVVDTSMNVPSIYRFICDPSYHNQAIWDKIYAHIKPFCVYFPQFHRLEENDVNYYPGMTDMTNFIKYNNDGNADNLDSPDLKTLGIGSLEEYVLSNPDLVSKQIDVAKAAGVYGFCIYYYWFSKNTITHRNSIMEKCYDNFFKKVIPGFKVFFNWANEDWKNTGGVKIINEYTDEALMSNIKNLSRYFLHPNYYKIDNRPVFLVHHPWLLGSKLQNLRNIFDEVCVSLVFSGIHIVMDSILTPYPEGFLHAPNYKNGKLLQYTEQVIRPQLEEIKTLFFSFNNTVRTYTSSTKPMVKISATQIEQKTISQQIVSTYLKSNRSELNKILLINSWNEWGENMAVEPGKHKKRFYIDLIKSLFASFITK